MPHIKPKDPTVPFSFRVRQSIADTLQRCAILLTEQSGDKHSDRQAGQALMDRFAAEYERELAGAVKPSDLTKAALKPADLSAQGRRERREQALASKQVTPIPKAKWKQ